MSVRLLLAAACLLDARGRLLLVRKRDSRFFMLPGGKLEPGEAPRQALDHELAAELGWQTRDWPLSELGEFAARAANEANTQVQAWIYVGRSQAEPRVAAELEEARWWTPDQVLNLAPLLEEQVLPALRARGLLGTA